MKGKIISFEMGFLIHFRAFMNWKRASNQNFPAARLRVGDHHWYGLGVERNYAQAALYYRMCSEDNDPHASAQVKYCYSQRIS